MNDETVVDDFYYPDETVISQRARDVVARISRFCLRLEYVEGKRFISLLTRHDLLDPDIALAVAVLHIQHGNLNGAEAVLQPFHVDEHSLECHTPLEDEQALLILLSAYIRIGKEFKTQEAVFVAEKISHMYMNQTWKLDEDLKCHRTKERVKAILNQRRLWQLDEAEYYDDFLAPITDRRVIIEDTILAIFERAASAGLIVRDVVTKRAHDHIQPLVRYLRAKNRHLSEATLMFSGMENIQSPSSVSTWWLQYSETFPEQSLLKAIVLSRCYKHVANQNTKEADELYNKVSNMFDTHQCATQKTLLRFLRLMNASQSVEGTTTKALTTDDLVDGDRKDGKMKDQEEIVAHNTNEDVADLKIRRYLSDLLIIHNELLKHHNLDGHSATTRYAISLVAKSSTLWPALIEFITPSTEQMLACGDQLKALVLQIFYFMDASDRFECAEEARAFFENLLATKGEVLTPAFYVAACGGAWRSHRTLGDYQKTLSFAELEFESPFCGMYEDRKSEAVARVAWSRHSLVHDHIQKLKIFPSDKAALRVELEGVVSLLREWIELDRAAGREVMLKDKNLTLIRVLQTMSHDLQVKDSGDRLVEEISSSQNGDAEGDLANESMRLLQMSFMLNQRRIEDVVENADRLYEDLLKKANSQPLTNMAVFITAIVTALQSSASFQPPISQELRKSIVERQYRYATSDLEPLKLTNNEIYLYRAPLLLWTVLECITFWPDRRNEYIEMMIQYFNSAHEVCRNARQTTLSQTDVGYWIQQRSLTSKFSFKSLCQTAAEFFLRAKMYQDAWTWIQCGRTQAMQDVLADRDTATKRVLLALNGDLDTSYSLAEEQRLLRIVNNVGPSQYFNARRQLEDHRESMRKSPLLRNIIDETNQPTTVNFDDIDDIWNLKAHLPADCNIVLVDWFIDTTGTLWRLDHSYKERDQGVRWIRGYTSLQKIQLWRNTYLKFPQGRVFKLESRFKALHELRTLLFQLEARCKPGDLVILSTTGALSDIPIHGIPFDGIPGIPLIERNPVIYSGGLNLLRQCLKRAHIPITVLDSTPLNRAIFTSAYEQEGHEEEKVSILSNLEDTAKKFNSKTLFAEQLTVESMQTALRTAPWVHYHGHAFYAKTEALNQCLVLGRLQNTERDIQSRTSTISITTNDEDHQRFDTEMPFEAPLTDREALLSAHLLQGTSRLSVADIYVMDITKTHPVVINIACDSGVQDFSPGDDPLGIMAALFCAGASSVLGTLWPIASTTGRLFADAFYNSVWIQHERNIGEGRNVDGNGDGDEDGSGGEMRRVVNLAFAFRDATLAVKKVRPDPYSWAGFVMQGAPLYFYGHEVEGVTQ